jgi:hypothetical protein
VSIIGVHFKFLTLNTLVFHCIEAIIAKSASSDGESIMITRFSIWRDFNTCWLRRRDTSAFHECFISNATYNGLAYLLGLLGISSFCLWVGGVFILFLAE